LQPDDEVKVEVEDNYEVVECNTGSSDVNIERVGYTKRQDTRLNVHQREEFEEGGYE
jgi:hypothetical protein